MSLPAVAPEVVAEAVAGLPNRLRGKLDQAVEKQGSWTVTATADGVVVAIDEQVSVVLTAPVDTPARAVCDCLLAPRCLHRAAVLSAAPVLAPAVEPAPSGARPADPAGESPPGPAAAGDGAPEAPSPGDGAPGPAGDGAPGPAGDGAPGPAGDGAPDPASAGSDAPDEGPSGGGPPVSAAEAAVVELVRRATADVLDRGIPGAGAVPQADLLRAIHQARAVGLPRLAAAGTRTVEQVRAARRGDAGFRLDELADDLRELLLVCHLLATGRGDTGAARGVGRRGYAPVGSLRLYGLFTEPVWAASGHAGVVTYLGDEDGTVWTVAQVRPGDAAVARTAGDLSVDLGEVRISHRDLGRAGLVAADARASADRRLSHGRAVQAVRAPGRTWTEEPFAGRWRQPVDGQAERWLAALDQPPQDRVAGHDLAYLDGVVAPPDRRALLVHVPDLDGPVAVVAPHDEPELPYVANLRQLAAHAAGRPVRLVGRFHGPRLVQGLAFAADWLPDRFGGHVDLGVDRLRRADLPGATPFPPVAGADGPYPPLHLLRHHLHRVVAAGRPALVPDLDQDLRRLLDAQLGTAAAALRQLRERGLRRNRDAFGRLDDHDPERLAAGWLAAAAYHRAAEHAAIRRSWRSSVEGRSAPSG